jgi:hypothetical protein
MCGVVVCMQDQGRWQVEHAWPFLEGLRKIGRPGVVSSIVACYIMTFGLIEGKWICFEW